MKLREVMSPAQDEADLEPRLRLQHHGPRCGGLTLLAELLSLRSVQIHSEPAMAYKNCEPILQSGQAPLARCHSSLEGLSHKGVGGRWGCILAVPTVPPSFLSWCPGSAMVTVQFPLESQGNRILVNEEVMRLVEERIWRWHNTGHMDPQLQAEPVWTTALWSRCPPALTIFWIVWKLNSNYSWKLKHLFPI